MVMSQGRMHVGHAACAPNFVIVMLSTCLQGRVHTSTATVAVMPEVDDVDVKIDPKVGP